MNSRHESLKAKKTVVTPFSSSHVNQYLPVFWIYNRNVPISHFQTKQTAKKSECLPYHTKNVLAITKNMGESSKLPKS